MRRILVISSLQIFPAESGGQLRTANICRGLSHLGHTVKLYSFTGRKAEYLERKPTSSQQINSQLTETTNRNPLFGALQFTSYKLGLPPVWITLLLCIFTPRDLTNEMQSADLIVLDFPFLWPLSILSRRFNIPVILNTHNLEWKLWTAKPLLAKLVRSIELKAVESADLVLFCDKTNEDHFTSINPRIADKSVLVPNGLIPQDYVITPQMRAQARADLKISDSTKVFIFTASRYEPNREALEFIKSQIQSRASELALHNILILVAGSVADAEPATGCLKILGRVNSMSPIFAAADFGLNPIFSGSGTNVKLMEYILLQIPVLSTTFGARGFDLSGDSHINIDPSNFVAQLIKASTFTQEQKTQMTAAAYEQNKASIDIENSLHFINKLTLKESRSPHARTT
jgi:hypothetical protein